MPTLFETVSVARKWLFQQYAHCFVPTPAGRTSPTGAIAEAADIVREGNAPGDRILQVVFDKGQPYQAYYNLCFCDRPFTDWMEQFGEADYLRIAGDIEQTFGKKKLFLFTKLHREEVHLGDIVDVLNVASLLPNECLVAHNRRGTGASDPRHVHFHLYANGMRKIVHNGQEFDLIDWLLENVATSDPKVFQFDNGTLIDPKLCIDIQYVTAPYNGLLLSRRRAAVTSMSNEHLAAIVFRVSSLNRSRCSLVVDPRGDQLRVFVIPRSDNVTPLSGYGRFGWREMHGCLTMSASSTLTGQRQAVFAGTDVRTAIRRASLDGEVWDRYCKDARKVLQEEATTE